MENRRKGREARRTWYPAFTYPSHPSGAVWMSRCHASTQTASAGKSTTVVPDKGPTEGLRIGAKTRRGYLWCRFSATTCPGARSSKLPGVLGAHAIKISCSIAAGNTPNRE